MFENVPAVKVWVLSMFVYVGGALVPYPGIPQAQAFADWGDCANAGATEIQRRRLEKGAMEFRCKPQYKHTTK